MVFVNLNSTFLYFGTLWAIFTLFQFSPSRAVASSTLTQNKNTYRLLCECWSTIYSSVSLATKGACFALNWGTFPQKISLPELPHPDPCYSLELWEWLPTPAMHFFCGHCQTISTKKWQWQWTIPPLHRSRQSNFLFFVMPFQKYPLDVATTKMRWDQVVQTATLFDKCSSTASSFNSPQEIFFYLNRDINIISVALNGRYTCRAQSKTKWRRPRFK